jgi:histidyl-tRNA synthetase
MHDLLPPESTRWRALVDRFATAFGAAGYGEVATPVLEELAVFQRAGEGTDIVSKEMYEFRDRDGSMIALRPESTAGVARAFVQHHPVTPWKVWYFSQHFRHERAQRGRTRQHHQLGVECFGVADPDLDVEVIVGLWDFLRDLGLRRLRLEVNDIGTAAERAAFVDALRTALAPIAEQLDPDDHPKLAGNTLRILDSKRTATRRALASADLPALADFTSADGATRFARVLDGVRAAGIEPVVNPDLVRGLDYYNGTVFEIVSDAIDAAQSTVGGGGRYDGLIESLGGEPTPGFGFGAGVERILLACDAEGAFPADPAALDAFVVGFGGDGTDERDLCRDLRRAGFAVDRAFDGRSGRAQMKLANRSGAAWAVIVGDDERAAGTVTVRDLRGGGDQQAVPRSDLIDHLRGLAADPARTS